MPIPIKYYNKKMRPGILDQNENMSSGKLNSKQNQAGRLALVVLLFYVTGHGVLGKITNNLRADVTSLAERKPRAEISVHDGDSSAIYRSLVDQNDDPGRTGASDDRPTAPPTQFSFSVMGVSNNDDSDPGRTGASAE
mmetsp:Transcript_29920/g.68661  ORF Transcript_29920/g.68661 Transcript_29920/m.68661 type:complete len:138 (-) Transcript_29920:78-491(-)